MRKRKYRSFAADSGSCTNFCVNVCTAVFRTGVQQCINDCLACGGESGPFIFLSDSDFFDDDDDEC